MNHSGEILDGLPVELVPPGEGYGPPRKSLAIVGSHPATRELAPYENNNFDIWLFNEAPQKPEVYRRWDASFQMHLPEIYASEHNWVNSEHWEWLQQEHDNRVIWMQDVDERVPNSRKYPLDDILALVAMPYLRSTPAMALALGIHLGYTDIWLYGSELSSNTEYTYQAINYAFWVGFAKGRGVNLHLECWQDEFYHQPIYGYEGEVQLDKAFFLGRVERIAIENQGKRQAFQKVLTKLEQAFEKNSLSKVGELSLLAENLAYAVGEMEGAQGEAQRYAERTNPISRQEFERVSAQAQKDGPPADGETRHIGGKAEYVWNVWAQTGALEAKNQLRQFIKEKNAAAMKAGVLAGIFTENMKNIQEYDKLVTAAGGKRAQYHVWGDVDA